MISSDFIAEQKMANFSFKNKTPDFSKLSAYGFVYQEGSYIYTTGIVENQFKMIVSIEPGKDVKTKVLDNDLGDEYILHLTPDAVGSFVGKVRSEYNNVLQDIADKCFINNVFKSGQSRQVIAYLSEKYQNEPEFLWEKFPENAIFRRTDTNKWFAALLALPKHKLGINSDETVEILDLRINPEQIACTVDNQKYFPGYHMNKKHWITICLDGSVSIDEIFRRIDDSYLLAVK